MSYDAKSNTNEFKIKDNSEKRTTGYRCQQKPKKYVAALFNDLMGDDNYQLFATLLEKRSKDNFNAIQICVLLELYFRLYNKENKDNKIWFLNPLEYIVKQGTDKKNSNKN